MQEIKENIQNEMDPSPSIRHQSRGMYISSLFHPLAALTPVLILWSLFDEVGYLLCGLDGPKVGRNVTLDPPPTQAVDYTACAFLIFFRGKRCGLNR